MLMLFPVWMQKILRFAQDAADMPVILSGAKDLSHFLLESSMIFPGN